MNHLPSLNGHRTWKSPGPILRPKESPSHHCFGAKILLRFTGCIFFGLKISRYPSGEWHHILPAILVGCPRHQHLRNWDDRTGPHMNSTPKMRGGLQPMPSHQIWANELSGFWRWNFLSKPPIWGGLGRYNLPRSYHCFQKNWSWNFHNADFSTFFWGNLLPGISMFRFRTNTFGVVLRNWRDGKSWKTLDEMKHNYKYLRMLQHLLKDEWSCIRI